MERFRGEDVCVDAVQDMAAALRDPHFAARGVWERQLRLRNGSTVPALPLPIAREFGDGRERGYPALGEHGAGDAGLWRRN